MAKYRPKYATVANHPNYRPKSPARSPPPPYKLGPANSPWQYNPVTGEVSLEGRWLESRERRLALLASRYPDSFNPEADANSKKGEYWRTFTQEDQKLLLLAKRIPLEMKEVFRSLDLEHDQQLSEMSAPSTTTAPLGPNMSTADPAPVAASPNKVRRESLPAIPTDRAPWSANLKPEEISAQGEPLNFFERRLIYLASRYPERFTDSGSYTSSRSRPALTGWERELVRAAKKFPLELPESSKEYDKYFQNHKKRHSLPIIPTDRSPWFLCSTSGDRLANGGNLTTLERRLVIAATRHPAKFTDNGAHKSKGEAHLTHWERELVRAAKKYPLDLKSNKGVWKDFAKGSWEPSSRTLSPGIPTRPNPPQTDTAAQAEDIDDTPMIDADFPTTNASTTKKNHSQHNGNTNRTPPPLRSYNPTSSFHALKKRILSNAHAYYTHRFPPGARYDVITSSTTPTNSLASTQYRAALIVYPDPKRRDWQVLYKSNPCPTVEDAAFEIKFWSEEDMGGVLKGMGEGAVWVKDVKGGEEEGRKEMEKGDREKKGNGNGGESEVVGEKAKQRGAEKGVGEVGVSKDKDEKVENATVEVSGTVGKPDASEDDAAAQQIQAESRASELKRKIHAADDSERKKAIKVTEGERVFVDAMDVTEDLSLIEEGDAVDYTSLFGGSSL